MGARLAALFPSALPLVQNRLNARKGSFGKTLEIMEIPTPKRPLSGPKDSHTRDRILHFLLRPEMGQFSLHFGAISLPKCTVNLEKGKKSTAEKKN